MSVLDEKLLCLLCCPECKGELQIDGDRLLCIKEARSFDIVEGIPVFHLDKDNTWDIDISSKKWSEFYKDFDWEGGRDHYSKTNFPYIKKHLTPMKQGDLFLELGGGASYLSYELAKIGVNVLMVDFDLDILRLARKSFQRRSSHGFFICANINKLPFKSNIFDSSAGIGVIEHSENIKTSICELNRVTKVGGYTFQTLPCFSLITTFNNSLRYGTFTPSFFLNKFIKFLHIKIFKSKYMKYGYEKSYTNSTLGYIFKSAEFDDVKVGFYDYNQTFLKKNWLLGKIFYYILRCKFFNRLPFADIIFVKAFKS